MVEREEGATSVSRAGKEVCESGLFGRCRSSKGKADMDVVSNERAVCVTVRRVPAFDGGALQ